MRLGARKKGADFDVKQTQSGGVTTEEKKSAEMHSLGLKRRENLRSWDFTGCKERTKKKHVMWSSG